ncbi:MAG TPA: sigma-54 dependent transcriptional regulator [Thermoanaerobaculia bacterium]|jgi:two-component system nitrogen regulation response regulator GlnG|nr:sigma-54 dependent transcriptional regulator [Thermoanaerobaculia bacterium]
MKGNSRESSEATAYAEVPGNWIGGRDRRKRSRTRPPALTVLFHPDPLRVGETASLADLLAGHSVFVSRLVPDFAQPGQFDRQPLGDRYLSRSPVRFSPTGEAGTVRMDPEEGRIPLTADGVPLTGPQDFPMPALERGVVIELSNRVVVLLHLTTDAPPHPPDLFGLVGASEAMARVRAAVRSVADLDVPVLLRGETGTGKELVAQAVHQASRRRGGPFVSVNMGAIPGTLAASELFGSVKGSFTGSVRDQIGYFQRAEGGTLFLDEIGEAPPEVQVMLLRVLETGQVQRVGGHEPNRANVRLVAATDADLEKAVEEERFRGPLLHRLSGYEVPVPPLRERREDFGRLLFHFLREEMRAVGQEARLCRDGDPWLPASIVARLARHPWPGNIRQLKNAVRELVINSRAAHASDTAQVGPQVERMLREIANATPAAIALESAAPAARQRSQPGAYRSPSEVTQEELLEALRANDWELKGAAGSLGVSRPALYLVLRKFPGIRTARDLSRAEILECRERLGDDLDAMARELEVSRKGLQQRMKEIGLT